jgi:hypothetical protein
MSANGRSLGILANGDDEEFALRHSGEPPRSIKGPVFILLDVRVNPRLVFPFSTDGFLLGSLGHHQVGEAGFLVRSGEASIIDRGIFEAYIQVGDELEFGQGDLISFCKFPGDPERQCGTAQGILTTEEDVFLFSSRVPLPGVTVSQFGTLGYSIGPAWWQRLVSEPLVVFVWAVFGAIYFLIGFWDRIRETVWKKSD